MNMATFSNRRLQDASKLHYNIWLEAIHSHSQIWNRFLICVKIYMHQTLVCSHSLEVLLLGERKDRSICGFTVCSNWKNVIFGYHSTRLPFRQWYAINHQVAQWFSTKAPWILAIFATRLWTWAWLYKIQQSNYKWQIDKVFLIHMHKVKKGALGLIKC